MKRENPSKPRKKPVQRRSLETVNVIFEAAAQVFAEMGYEHATTDRIAERAGVSIGSLYQYFPNKEAIALGLLENHSRQARLRVMNVLEQGLENRLPIKQILRQTLNEILTVHEDRPNLYRVLDEEVPRPPELNQESRKGFLLFSEKLGSTIRQQSGNQFKSPKIMSQFITIAIQDLVHSYISRQHPELEREVFLDELALMLYRYLEPEE